jgi:hypothetical protein
VWEALLRRALVAGRRACGSAGWRLAAVQESKKKAAAQRKRERASKTKDKGSKKRAKTAAGSDKKAEVGGGAGLLRSSPHAQPACGASRRLPGRGRHAVTCPGPDTVLCRACAAGRG